MRVRYFLSTLIAASIAEAGTGTRIEFARRVFQCQLPLVLQDFRTHLSQGFGHRAIQWNLTALDPAADMRLRLVQISYEGVSPSAALRMMPEGPRSFEVPMRAMTLERKWLETLRGTEAVDLLPAHQQLVLWINETYHLFAIQPEDLEEMPRTEVFYRALNRGAYVFTGEKAAFIVGKDLGSLTVCPRLDDGKVQTTPRALSNDVIRFTQDIRVRKFFSCEALLIRR
jgi:hypothetical protein